MYELAGRVGPEEIFAISRYAFAELALSGVTAVGEFHYLHHQPDGRPYADRTILADAVIRAAREVGLRITLLRVLYHRAGWNRPPEGAQRRFSDPALEPALEDVSELERRHAADPLVRIGVAPHSVRAVPSAWLLEAARFAEARLAPLHAHLSEQRREVRECLAEHGLRPVHLLEQAGALSDRFVAVHATHLSPSERRALGQAHAFACIARTTERDLGDGLPDAAGLLREGVRLCAGVDSHASSDPFEEVRAIELDERSRAEARIVCAQADTLLEAASAHGYQAIGMAGLAIEDEVRLDPADPALVGLDAETAVDAAIFAAGPRAVREVRVAGRPIVSEGQLPGFEAIREAYLETLRSLGLG